MYVYLPGILRITVYVRPYLPGEGLPGASCSDFVYLPPFLCLFIGLLFRSQRPPVSLCCLSVFSLRLPSLLTRPPSPPPPFSFLIFLLFSIFRQFTYYIFFTFLPFFFISCCHLVFFSCFLYLHSCLLTFLLFSLSLSLPSLPCFFLVFLCFPPVSSIFPIFVNSFPFHSFMFASELLHTFCTLLFLSSFLTFFFPSFFSSLLPLCPS